MIDALTSLAFSVYENKGVYCLLIGSGVSRRSEIPTGWEITLDLVRRIGALQGVKDAPDWAAWYREKFGVDPKYSDLLDQLSTTPDERRAILHNYIEPTPDDIEAGKKTPTAAHQAIARLVSTGFVRVIITTNFDRLLENALREAGVEPTVIVSDDAIDGAVPLIHSRCYVVKVHGDYLDTRIRNTDAELGVYTARLDALLDRIIDEHGLIICGWSGDWDPALRAAITRAPNRRYPLYWAARGSLSEIAQTLVNHRVGKVIQIESADVFLSRLESMVVAQVEAQRTNPRSVAIMVSSAKRFLAHSEFRIQLDELIGEELRRLHQFTSREAAEANGAWSNERYVSAVQRYEAQCEPLTRIFGVVGRFGTETDFSGAAEIIARLSYRDAANGLTAILGLLTYPAVLLFYGYGLGLLKARRYAELFRLFSTRVWTRRDRTETVVSHLFLGTWEGNQRDYWKLLPNLSKSQSALSDHLHELFEVWTSDYVFTKPEYTALFEHFELLASLTYLSRAVDKAKLYTCLTGSNNNFVPMQLGRVVWDESVRCSLMEAWKGDLQKELLDAGFAQGDQEFLSLAIQNIERISERFGW
ncbi:SIR2 family protein [Rhodopseudomonas parapalustris]